MIISAYLSYMPNANGEFVKFQNFDVYFCETTQCYTFKAISKADNVDFQVLKYGSDPLKTYLPDSDIDITLILNNNLKFSNGTNLYVATIDQLKLVRDFLEKYQELDADVNGDGLDATEERDQISPHFAKVDWDHLHQNLGKEPLCLLTSLLKQ